MHFCHQLILGRPTVHPVEHVFIGVSSQTIERVDLPKRKIHRKQSRSEEWFVLFRQVMHNNKDTRNHNNSNQRDTSNNNHLHLTSLHSSNNLHTQVNNSTANSNNSTLQHQPLSRDINK